ncbi:hypothetical protein Sjap_019299 [Stephania japonica]|uniref:Uncharacterized protein n=1 Tax=Stephania japonica TaxID=461633 RepID=A0AAP0HZD4_9MAGN
MLIIRPMGIEDGVHEEVRRTGLLSVSVASHCQVVELASLSRPPLMIMEIVCSTSLHPLMAVKSEPIKPILDNAKRRKTNRVLMVRSGDPNPQLERKEDNNKNKGFSYQEDLGFLWKLGGGSVGGAAVIKYGSVLFPQITRPNIVEAMALVLTPVIVAVFILVKQSYIDQRSKG